MLHDETVDKFTLELLKKLQSLRMFSEMRLVGQMSLALQIGYRKSIDIDLYYILRQYDLTQLLSFYGQKYPDGSSFLDLKSLVYFEDAENEAMPWMFQDLSWEEVKMTIQNAHVAYLLSSRNDSI